MMKNPSILGSSLGAFDAAGSRKDQVGFNINVSSQSLYQTQKKPRGPIKAQHLASNSSYHRIIPK